MQGTEEQAVISGTEPNVPPFGEVCMTTRRVVIVSPFPYSLNELIGELTADCYDVMVFHHFDAQALSKLPMDLLIMDLTKEKDAGLPDAHKLPSQVPALFLVDQEFQAADQDSIVHWPLPTNDLLERMETMLVPRNPIRKPSVHTELIHKDLHIDLNRMACYRGTTRIDLTKTEFDLLQALIEASGAVLSRQNLMDRIWGEHYFGGSNTLDVHMKSLRQKLHDSPKTPKYIATVRGIGYRLADD